MQAEKTAQIDGLYAQKLDERNRFETQGDRGQTIIRDPEDRNKKSENETVRREAAKENELAQLKDQIHRMQIDRDDQAAQVEAWQVVATKQQTDKAE